MVGDPHGVGPRTGDLSIHIGAVLDHQIQKRGIRRTAASPATRINAGRQQEWRETHGVDVGVGALGQKSSNDFHVASLGCAIQRRASRVQLFFPKASAIAAPAGAMHIELRIRIDIRGQQPVDDVHT